MKELGYFIGGILAVCVCIGLLKHLVIGYFMKIW